METRDMVRMANQIAAFFTPYPEQEAIDGIAEHLTKFWDPRMRSMYFDHVASGGAGFLPLVLAAATKVKRPKVAV